jgi:type I restriction enzyme S subunit
MAVEEHPFSELLSVVIDNRGKTCPTADSGIPLIATNCIRNEQLYPTYDKVRFVSKETYSNWFRAHPLPGDIIFVNKATPGRVCLVPDPVDFCIAQDMVAVRADPKRVYPKYLFAVLRSPAVQEKIGQMHVGTLIPHFKKGDFDKLLIPIPGRKTQEFIGNAYFALSAKSNANRRINATLEAMARALFQSWFVDFDPVRAKLDGRKPEGLDEATAALFTGCFQESALGEIPNGWRLGTLGELVQLRTDRVEATPAKDGMRYIALEDMPSKSIDLSNYQLGSAVNSSITAFRRGDILFGSMRPYFHKVGLAFFDGITRTTTFVLRPRKDYFRHFALMHFFSNDVIAHSTTASVGTTIPYVRWDSMESYRVPIPPDSLLEVFEKMVSPLVQRIATQGEESCTLAILRDTLLPKLLNGDLSVDKIREGLVA